MGVISHGVVCSSSNMNWNGLCPSQFFFSSELFFCLSVFHNTVFIYEFSLIMLQDSHTDFSPPSCLISSPLFAHSRLAGCYVGPVARGWDTGADVVPGGFGRRVHRHKTAILRTRCLHALCCRSACTDTPNGYAVHN